MIEISLGYDFGQGISVARSRGKVAAIIVFGEYPWFPG